jgi:hypothetical protein
MCWGQETVVAMLYTIIGRNAEFFVVQEANTLSNFLYKNTSNKGQLYHFWEEVPDLWSLNQYTDRKYYCWTHRNVKTLRACFHIECCLYT